MKNELKLSRCKRLGRKNISGVATHNLPIMVVGLILVGVYLIVTGAPKPLDVEISNLSNTVVRIQVFFDEDIVIDEVLLSGQSYREEFDIDGNVTISIILESGIEYTAPSAWGMNDELNVRINPDWSLTYKDGDGNVLIA
jgi:hypothetical protein